MTSGRCWVRWGGGRQGRLELQKWSGKEGWGKYHKGEGEDG